MRFLRGFVVIRGGVPYPNMGYLEGCGVHTLRYKESLRPPQMIRRCVTIHLQRPKSGHPKHFFPFHVQVEQYVLSICQSPRLVL